VDDVVIATDSNSIFRDRKYYRYIYLEPGTSSISFSDGDMEHAVYNGSLAQKEYDALQAVNAGYNQVLKQQGKLLDSVRQLLKKGMLTTEAADKRVLEIRKLRNAAEDSVSATEMAFVRSYPKSFVSLTLLKDFVGHIANDTIDALYAGLSSRLKGCTLDNVFTDYYRQYKMATSQTYAFDRITTGNKAPPFSIYSCRGKDTITNADFYGKVLLIEFWGIECLPCLRKNPGLELLRKKFSSKEIEIIAVSEDGAKYSAELVSCIRKNNLGEWIHVAANTIVEKGRPILYTGNFKEFDGLGIPRTVIIDKKGTVAYVTDGYYEGELDAIAKLIQELLR
jgi:peroxiredoxin